MSEIKNRMVLLAEQLRELTHGICKMGPGPYGIGVSTNAVSPLTAILLLTPEPFKEGNICLPGNQTCTVEMCAFTEEQRALRTYLTRDELAAFSQGDDPAARIVAEAILRMNDSGPVVTAQECNDAFDILADWEINGQGDPSAAETEFIASLSKTSAPKAGMEMTM